MAISESFLKKGHNTSKLQIPHYKLLRNDRVGAACGGVAMYIHESLKPVVVTRSPTPTVYIKRPEYLFVEIKVAQLKFLCALVYNPPRAGYWGETVEEALLNCDSAYDNIFLLGDFNID